MVNAIINTCSADIIIGTETWLSADVENSELSLPNDFAIFRKDRNESRGGGVLIAIRSDYQPALVSLDTPLELICVMMRLKGITYVLGAL